MGDFDVKIQRLCIAERRLDPGMAEPFLDLINGHTALESQGGGGMAENVRRNFDGNLTAGNDRPDGFLDGLFSEAMGAAGRNEKRWTFVRTGGKVSAKGYFRFRVQEGGTAFPAFPAADMNDMLREIDIADVHGAEF